MKKKKIFLAHNNPEIIEEFSKLVSRSGLYELVDYVYDGEGFEKLESFDLYDIVIVKDAITYVTGIYMIKRLLKRTTHQPELIIVLTPFSSPFIRGLCKSLNIVYRNIAVTNGFHLMDILYKYDLTDGYRNKRVFDTQYEIITLLKKCGLIRRYKGYKYFEYIINRMFDEPALLSYTMQQLYDLIAEHFNVSKVSVEKAMRICLKNSLLKNSNFYVRSLFGYDETKEMMKLPSTTTFIHVCIKTLKDQKTYVALNALHETKQRA